ncbi:hypothetical protein ILUMI_24150 [Ignelater luminosus]|uniref:XPG N-terminal domain-containing protein n=1 Tax=Ignelater luminosus TaxID=2038154 RepID=A0A8K0CE05_IGNLU|nr:hypothetical protein ILUMI_24150 [Ignelater luminosus]
MGVTGLWRLIEPSGKPVPLETLENKVLAVDVSIWLHQAIKGFQDVQGAPLPNAHLLGIYHRVCKLLYFRIKPVFVFDGGVPNLKKETISKRNQQKSKRLSEAERIQRQLLTTLLKHTAVNKVLSEKAKATLATKANSSKATVKEKNEDIYKLPPSALDSTLSSSEDESASGSTSTSPIKQWDLHTIDEKSPHFKALPADVRHEILTDLKETRKQSSWGKIHEMPKQSDGFSSFQMNRLLKRYSVQTSLEEAEKEMGGRTLSLAELETLLKDQGVVTSSNSVGKRIASDEHTRYVLIKDVQKAMDEAKKLDDIEEEETQEIDEDSKDSKEEKAMSDDKTNNTDENSTEGTVQTDNAPEITNNGDIEFQKDLEKAIQLSLQDVPSTSKENNNEVKVKKKFNFSFLEGFNDADFQSSSESEEESNQKDVNILASAKSYMTEYSGLTPNEIAKIIGSNLGLSKKNKNNEVSSTSKSVQPANRTINIKESNLEETGDAIISSSTATTSALNKIEAKESNIPDNNSEVSSSTSKSDNLTMKDTENITEDSADKTEVRIISDEGSSDDSDEFLEVNEKQSVINKDSKQFEILVKPEDTLEDDIFSDIFTNEPEPVDKLKLDSNKSKPVENVTELEMVSSTNNIDVNKEVSDIQEIEDDKSKEVALDENKISQKELTKKRACKEYNSRIHESDTRSRRCSK